MASIVAGNAVTPMTRLNWRDLLEPNAEPGETEVDVSPNDKLMWNNQQDSDYAAALSPMMLRKGKKRARSSSPTSSPATDKGTFPVVNVNKLKTALRSPHADPTLELWDRYSLNGPENMTTPKGAVNPALAQLMISSSPKPSKDLSSRRGGDANLRRAISCGLNWPKRRKVERSKSGSQSSSQQREMEAASKSSLVTALLDTVTSSIHEPSPGRTQEQLMRSPSPKKRRLSPKQLETPCRARSIAKPSSPSSDYGDDDFDDDAFMELEASLQVTSTTNTPLPDGSDPGMLDQREHQLQHGRATDLPDGFDDFEDDHTFDKAVPPPNAGLGITTPKKQTDARAAKPQGSPGDEFGDDFDGDIDFDAVELAATQSVQQLEAPSESVRQSIAKLSQCSIY